MSDPPAEKEKESDKAPAEQDEGTASSDTSKWAFLNVTQKVKDNKKKISVAGIIEREKGKESDHKSKEFLDMTTMVEWLMDAVGALKGDFSAVEHAESYYSVITKGNELTKFFKRFSSFLWNQQ